MDAPYYVGQGFSDHCFLVERARLAGDIYRYRHPAGARYPLSELGDTFEKRVDAYMRCNNCLRLTDPRVRWIHHGTFGQHYARTAAWPLPQAAGRSSRS